MNTLQENLKFADKLKKLRLDNKLSQLEMSVISGTGYLTYCLTERGGNSSDKTKAKILEAIKNYKTT